MSTAPAVLRAACQAGLMLSAAIGTVRPPLVVEAHASRRLSSSHSSACARSAKLRCDRPRPSAHLSSAAEHRVSQLLYMCKSSRLLLLAPSGRRCAGAGRRRVVGLQLDHATIRHLRADGRLARRLEQCAWAVSLVRMPSARTLADAADVDVCAMSAMKRRTHLTHTPRRRCESQYTACQGSRTWSRRQRLAETPSPPRGRSGGRSPVSRPSTSTRAHAVRRRRASPRRC